MLSHPWRKYTNAPSRGHPASCSNEGACHQGSPYAMAIRLEMSDEAQDD